MRVMGTIENRSRVSSRIATGLVLLAALPGCKKGENSGEYVCGDNDRAAYVAQSREYKAGDGGSIATAKSVSPITEGYFDKPYNQDWLAAVERSSILETINYIETKGVKVYKADSASKKSAHPLESASVMTWDIDREWRLADQPMAGSRCGFLAGLYLGRGKVDFATKREIPSLKNQAAIIVREDASRWTLVHEFMHHNFRSQAAAQGYNDNRLQSRRKSLSNEINRLRSQKNISNREYAQRMTTLFLEQSSLVDEMIVHYQFEEVTIEATLQDRYESGRFTYVPAGAYTNATWYIGQAKRVAEEVYRGMDASYDELFRLTSTNGLFAEMKKLAKYTNSRDERLEQLGKVISRHQTPSGARHRGMMAMTDDFSPTSGSMPCALAQQVESDLSEIGTLMLLVSRRL